MSESKIGNPVYERLCARAQERQRVVDWLYSDMMKQSETLNEDEIRKILGHAFNHGVIAELSTKN